MGYLIGVAIVLAVIVLIVRRGLQMKQLAHLGVVGTGTVLRKFHQRSGSGTMSSAVIRYQFHTPAGHRIENKIHVAEGVFEEYEAGDPIDIVYLEARPQVNAARYMVNHSRKALNLPPL